MARAGKALGRRRASDAFRPERLRLLRAYEAPDDRSSPALLGLLATAGSGYVNAGLTESSLLNNFGNDEVHCWLKLIILMFATSYRVKEPGRSFKSEYIVSQSLMLGAKKLGFDGVAYYSKRVRNDAFSLCAINLALFMNYRKQDNYPDLVDHIKLDDSFNFSVFKQLLPCARAGQYELRSVNNPYIVNISTNNEDRQFSFRDTEFYEFDCFLFDSWTKKRGGRDKDSLSWGHANV